jgi:Tfp pilus assembly protein PilZ
VWFTSPGQENTLQTDYRYYGKASNGQVIVSTDKAFHIGDSIVCVFITAMKR